MCGPSLFLLLCPRCMTDLLASSVLWPKTGKLPLVSNLVPMEWVQRGVGGGCLLCSDFFFILSISDSLLDAAKIQPPSKSTRGFLKEF